MYKDRDILFNKIVQLIEEYDEHHEDSITGVDIYHRNAEMTKIQHFKYWDEMDAKFILKAEYKI